MKREEAIKRIVELKINNLNKDKRAGYLDGWWNIDKTDKEFQSLPEALQKEMEAKGKYGDSENKKYGPIDFKSFNARIQRSKKRIH